MGWLRWPYAHSRDLGQLFLLLCSQLCFTVIVGAPVAWLCSKGQVPHLIRWGNWLRPVPVGSSLLIWAGAVAIVYTRASVLNFVFFAAILMTLIKSALSAGIQETVFRGLIQPCATASFGVPAGIVIQAFLYGLFHVNLGAVLVSKPMFLFVVFLLGVIFGYVSRKTHGIGWACVVHAGLDMVVEWRNLSITF